MTRLVTPNAASMVAKCKFFNVLMMTLKVSSLVFRRLAIPNKAGTCPAATTRRKERGCQSKPPIC